jgi:hypothetical protein
MTGFDNPTGERLFALSDITPNEVFGLNLIKSYADKFSSPLADDWIKRHLLFRISRLRIGRKELVLLLSGIAQSEKSGKKKSLSDLFSGLKIIGIAPAGFGAWLSNLSPMFLVVGMIGTIGLSLLIHKIIIKNVAR